MSHLLEINDNDNIQLFDMLGTVLGIDLASRQISPIGNERYEERFRIFGGDANSANDISNMVFTLDQVVNDITNYGNAPSLNTPIWLHEKSEGETSELRRAPLFSATFQPTTEGSVGQLQIMNGIVGLLMLERGEWEKITPDSFIVYDGYPADLTITDRMFGTELLSDNDGTISGRIKQVSYYVENAHISYFSMGIREQGFGVANFQNCISLGSGRTLGTSGTGWLLDSNAGATDPVGQTNTYNRVRIDPSVATHTHVVKLNEVTESTLDSYNEHYVSNYKVVLRTKQTNMLDAYFKITFSYGYENEMIDNPPIYINGYDTYKNIEVGNISIPNFPYQPNEGGTSDLSNFTFALKVELVGSPAGLSYLYADSLFLIPSSNLTITDIKGDPNGTDEYTMTMWVLNHPNGSYYFRAEDGQASSEIASNLTVPTNGGLVSFLNENYEVAALPGNSWITIAMSYFDRYNSLAVV